MNEKDFVRRDVYEAEKENLLGIIKDTRDRLEDYKESSTRQITLKLYPVAWAVSLNSQ